MDILDMISKIGEKETQMLNKVFISPVFSNTLVATRVDGMVYSFFIPKVVGGWYQIKPVDIKRAKIIGPAEISERDDYLRRLDKIRIVLVMKRDGVFFGVPDKVNKFGFQVNDLLPVFLHDDSALEFDRIIARFDGANIWFEVVDQGNDPAKADYLRTCMLKVLDPLSLKFSGLTLEERLAYTLRLTLDKKLVADRQKDGLQKAVEFAGGSFISFVERSDHYSVTYQVGGDEYTSYVSKDPVHSVISAGLCLRGNDKLFDLKSLVTVIREGQQKDLIHHYHLRA
jgi:hypothetical protein